MTLHLKTSARLFDLHGTMGLTDWDLDKELKLATISDQFYHGDEIFFLLFGRENHRGQKHRLSQRRFRINKFHFTFASRKKKKFKVWISSLKFKCEKPVIVFHCGWQMRNWLISTWCRGRQSEPPRGKMNLFSTIRHRVSWEEEKPRGDVCPFTAAGPTGFKSMFSLWETLIHGTFSQRLHCDRGFSC